MSRDKRNEPRQGVSVRALVRNGSGAARKVRLSSLSTQGCRFSSRKRMGPGAFLTIRLEQIGVLDGKVEWRDGDLHGIRFIEALHPAVLDHLCLSPPELPPAGDAAPGLA